MLSKIAKENRDKAEVCWNALRNYVRVYCIRTKSGRYRIRYRGQLFSGRNIPELYEKCCKKSMIDYLSWLSQPRVKYLVIDIHPVKKGVLE